MLKFGMKGVPPQRIFCRNNGLFPLRYEGMFLFLKYTLVCCTPEHISITWLHDTLLCVLICICVNVNFIMLLQLHYISSAISLYFPYDFCLYPGMTALVSYSIRYIPFVLGVTMSTFFYTIHRFVLLLFNVCD